MVVLNDWGLTLEILGFFILIDLTMVVVMLFGFEVSTSLSTKSKKTVPPSQA